MNLSPIPNRPFPGRPAGLSESAEPLVDLAETISGALDVTMMYHRQGVPGAISRCFLRAEAAHRLQEALSMLRRATDCESTTPGVPLLYSRPFSMPMPKRFGRKPPVRD